MKRFFRYLTERHKLSLRNIRTGNESWHLFTNRLRLTLSFIALVVILFFVIISLVAYTPILDWIPGYPGSKSRRLIVQNIQRLDSLESQLRDWDNHSSQLRLILEGNTIPELDKDSTKVGADGHPFPRSISDSLLRMQIENDPEYQLLEQKPKRTEETFKMFPPVRGTVTAAFDLESSIYGVTIVPQPNQSIVSVLDGTIILNSWDPNSGHTIVIEHAANMVSIYKKITRSLYKTGDRVRAGEAIAMTSSVVDGKMPNMIFELWVNGSAVDPEKYITF